jgi:hypothetical protein
LSDLAQHAHQRGLIAFLDDDRVEEIALLHLRAVGEGLALDQPRDLGADLDRVRRLGLGDVFAVDGDWCP